MKYLRDKKNMPYFALAKQKQRVLKLMVPWMSGLVSGLQNHVRRFESARNLEILIALLSGFFVYILFCSIDVPGLPN